MKKIYYWAPCLTKVGTYKATINSAISLSKFSKENISVKIINTCGEWNSKRKLFKEHNIEIIDLTFNYYELLPKNGFFKSRFSFLLISLFSFVPLIKLLLKDRPDFMIFHLLTGMPLIIKSIFNFKTEYILRISGYPKLNFFRKFLWKICSYRLFKVTCPSLDLKNQLINLKIFKENKLVYLPDPILNLKGFKKKNLNLDNNFERMYFISVGRLTDQKNFEYLINEFTKFAQINLDYDLYIYGDGENRLKLSKQIIKNKMNNRIFLKGYTNNVNFYMKKAEALILSSLWEDPGFVLIEAALNNLFLISSDCKNGPKEILDNGKRGFLFKNDEANALYNSLQKFIDLKNNNSKKIKSFLLAAKIYSKNYTLLNHYKSLNKILIK